MDDTISRQDTIDVIKKHLHDVVDGEQYDKWIAFGYEAAHEDIIEIIDKVLPSAQQDDCQKCIFSPFKQFKQKQKVRRWYDKTDKAYAGGGYTECSVCGNRYSWGAYFEVNNFRFCPKCGAKMRKE